MGRERTPLSEKELSERFNDTEGILRALRRAALFARLRSEMWARFRESIEQDAIDNGPEQPVDKMTMTERFNDDVGITRALRRAAEFARLRREMWERFRASIAAESGQDAIDNAPDRNGDAPPAPGS